MTKEELLEEEYAHIYEAEYLDEKGYELEIDADEYNQLWLHFMSEGDTVLSAKIYLKLGRYEVSSLLELTEEEREWINIIANKHYYPTTTEQRAARALQFRAGK